MPTVLESILKKEQEFNERTAKEAKFIQLAKLVAIRNTKITCHKIVARDGSKQWGCGKASLLKNWTLQRSLFYDYNTGSPNGGFWCYSKAELDHLVCPTCGYENYIYTHPQKEKILNLLKLVKSGNEIEIFKAVTEKQHRN